MYTTVLEINFSSIFLLSLCILTVIPCRSDLSLMKQKITLYKCSQIRTEVHKCWSAVRVKEEPILNKWFVYIRRSKRLCYGEGRWRNKAVVWTTILYIFYIFGSNPAPCISLHFLRSIFWFNFYTLDSLRLFFEKIRGKCWYLILEFMHTY